MNVLADYTDTRAALASLRPEDRDRVLVALERDAGRRAEVTEAAAAFSLREATELADAVDRLRDQLAALDQTVTRLTLRAHGLDGDCGGDTL